GPVAIKRILHDIDAETVTGRLVLIPVLNPSAFAAASRESAEDDGNLNRAFPGDANGSITSRFAAFVTEQVFPHVHLVFDLHAGGECARFALNNSFRSWDDPAQQNRMEKLARGFGCPFSITFDGEQSTGYLTGMAESLGKLVFGAELGHGAAVNHEGVAMAMQGLLHAMHVEGIVNTPPPEPILTPGEQVLVKAYATDPSFTVLAPWRGHFEPLVALGARVEAGQALAQLHDFERIDSVPLLLTADNDGYVISQAWGAEVKQGQILILLGKEEPWSEN
ncbi:MAG: succinylglutamate desuccinylase/aspartoacylase family protein, partial [Lentisphaeria bacterium]|nr:succinylglutamate desuccinylase/aspartoacylase family protein [Lentisphaeria bacterium]